MVFSRKLALACIAAALAVGALFILLVRGPQASREPAPQIVAAVAPVEPVAEPGPAYKPWVPAPVRKGSEPTGEIVEAGAVAAPRGAMVSGTGAMVSGTVRTKSGVPVVEAELSIIPRGSTPPGDYGRHSARTTSSGTYELGVPEGIWVIRASAGRYPEGTSNEIEVGSGERHESIDIELPESCTIEGYVFIAGTEESVENATVSCTVQSSHPWRQYPTGVATRADGYFVLEEVPEGNLTVTAFHPEYAPRIMHGVQAKAAERASVRIELGAGGTVRGRAIRSGKPLVSCWVQAGPRSGGPGGRRAQTGLDGSFELKGLASGFYGITVEEPGRSGAPLHRIVSVVEGQLTEVNLEDGAGVRLSGRILSRGGDVPTGRVQAMRVDLGRGGVSESEIGPGGEYSLDLSGQGAYTLIIGSKSRGGQTKLEVIVPPGLEEIRRDIELPSGSVTGTIVDAATEGPIPHVQVGAFLAGSRGESIHSFYRAMQGMGRADDQGRFVLPNLPDGSYDLRAFTNGYVQVRRASIQVSAGTSLESRVEMQKAMSFTARAEDSDGRPLAGALALLRHADGNLILSGSPTRSSGDGMLEVHTVGPGTYRMAVLHQAHAHARAVISVLEDGTVSPQPVFRLEKGGRIRVRVASRTEAVDGASAEVIDDAGEDLMHNVMGETALATGPDGLLEVGLFPAAVYRVSVIKDGRRSNVEKLTVHDGETTETTFTLE